MSERKGHQGHRGDLVKVGDCQLFLGGAMYRPFLNLECYDIVISFLEVVPARVINAVTREFRHYPIPDFGGVPDDWTEFLAEVVRELKAGRKVIGFCMGGHGRTGTFLASLIALLEPEIEDPITEARIRYCEHAVEMRAQAEAVFALKGQPLPVEYTNFG